MPTNIQELDRRAVLASVAEVARVRPDDLDRPTPCAGWTLRDLLAHMTVQHLGFAAAASGATDGSVWSARLPAGDPVAGYRAAAHQVLDAFATEGGLDRPFALPEISSEVTFPGRVAIGFHFIDYLVHGWDVATALGVPYTVDSDLAGPALVLAARVPGGAARLAPGAAFGPAVEVPPDAPVFDRVLAVLGRSVSAAGTGVGPDRT